MTKTLEKIISEKRISIEKYKNSLSINVLEKKISSYKNYINFKNNLNKNIISVIAEIKKASPSAGIIIDNYDPKEIAKKYLNSGASCLSILTEENNFKGKLEHIIEVKNKVKLPVLCKDFFIDPYQVYLAKSFGADAILIILSAVNDKTAKEIYSVAEELELSTIVEVHTQEEAKNAFNYKNAIIGINNRNLKNLETNINTTYDIYDVLLNHKGPLISESGIKNKDDILNLSNKTKIKTFLIGESLLKNLSQNPIFSVL